MGCVGDELTLSREDDAEALGHVVEGDRDLLRLARAADLCAGFEISFLHAPRSLRQLPQGA